MRTKDRSSIKTAQAQRQRLFEAMAATRAAVTLAVQAKNRLRTSTRRLSTNPMYNWPGNSCPALLSRFRNVSRIKVTQRPIGRAIN